MQIQVMELPSGEVMTVKTPTPTRTQKYLRQLAKKHGLANQNQMAKHLGVNRVAASRWYWGEQNFSDEIALKVAADLEIEPSLILAEMQAERTHGAVKAAWERLLDNFDDWRKR